MHKDVFEVIKPGLLTTVQDLGRFGYQQYGMVVSGAMDSYALRIGNLLVGNEEGEAGLEITVIGPVLCVLSDGLIAITGGDLDPYLDGQPVDMWKSVNVRRGSILRFGRVKQGMRAYVTIRGGIDVPTVMGSKSTYIKAGIGGFHGRSLRGGDVLATRATARLVDRHVQRSLHPDFIPVYPKEAEARVILGPQEKSFTDESLTDFFTQTYKIMPESDRMGYRLQGKALRHKASADLITDPVPLGAIQVPANGQPILLLAERQPTGGYPKIGTVISVDLPAIAQLMPGACIRFHPVSLEEGQQLLYEQERLLRLLSIGTNGRK